MRTLNCTRVSAPSASLLRFLRAQTEEICFFTPTTISAASWNLRASKPHSYPLLKRKPQSRGLSTTSRREATVESSLLNLDFLRTRPKRDLLYCPTSEVYLRPRFTNSNTNDKLGETRNASSDSRPFFQRWWHPKINKALVELKSDDLPVLPGILDDSRGSITGRSVGKAPNELRLRCTEFDESGKVTLMSGEFKKSVLIAKVNTILQVWSWAVSDYTVWTSSA